VPDGGEFLAGGGNSFTPAGVADIEPAGIDSRGAREPERVHAGGRSRVLEIEHATGGAWSEFTKATPLSIVRTDPRPLSEQGVPADDCEWQACVDLIA
jgi:hypothetical protein